MDYDYGDMACWQDLANAVIRQAAEDYRSCCAALKRRPDLSVQAKHKRKLEDFFRSRWFRTLSEADGIEIMETIRKEIGSYDGGNVF